MNLLKEAWFWLVIIGVIGFIVSAIGYETTRVNSTTTQSSVPAWVWAIMIVSVVLVFIGVVIFFFRQARLGRTKSEVKLDLSKRMEIRDLSPE